MSNGKVNSTVTEDISIGSGDDGIDLNEKATLQQNQPVDEEKQRLMQEYREELTKIQEDINTLRLVLNDKLKRESELKTLLGISFVDEIKQDFSEGFNAIKSTSAFQIAAQAMNELGSTVTQNDAFQKTSVGLKTATSKITPAFQTLGCTMKNSIGNLRNTSMFKSIEGIGSWGKLKNSRSEFIVDGTDTNGSSMTTSQSTLGNLTNGSSKHDTILEDEKN